MFQFLIVVIWFIHNLCICINFFWFFSLISEGEGGPPVGSVALLPSFPEQLVLKLNRLPGGRNILESFVEIVRFVQQSSEKFLAKPAFSVEEKRVVQSVTEWLNAVFDRMLPPVKCLSLIQIGALSVNPSPFVADIFVELCSMEKCLPSARDKKVFNWIVSPTLEPRNYFLHPVTLCRFLNGFLDGNQSIAEEQELAVYSAWVRLESLD